MIIEVIRVMCGGDCTIGKMYVDGVEECYTLEDVIRPDGEKVYGETAIPAARYRVIINRSNRFGVDMPLLLDVPGFSGVRIHPGNTAKDTHGCILVGLSQGGASIGASRLAYDSLFHKIGNAISDGGEVWIDIKEA